MKHKFWVEKVNLLAGGRSCLDGFFNGCFEVWRDGSLLQAPTDSLLQALDVVLANEADRCFTKPFHPHLHTVKQITLGQSVGAKN